MAGGHPVRDPARVRGGRLVGVSSADPDSIPVEDRLAWSPRHRRHRYPAAPASGVERARDGAREAVMKLLSVLCTGGTAYTLDIFHRESSARRFLEHIQSILQDIQNFCLLF